MVSSRISIASALLLCLIIFASAVYIQNHYGLAPCPLCMLQRFSMIGIGLSLFIWLIHHPSGWGRFIYGGLCLILSCIGLGLASRQVWLQHQPITNTHASCLPGLSYLFQHMSFGHALKLALHGSQECGSVHWSLFGLSIANWSLLVFALLIVLTLQGMKKTQRY